MIEDVNERILSFLQAALPSYSIWAGVTFPPSGYDPASSGRGIAFKVRGGNTDAVEESDLLRPSVQFKAYGSSERDAWQAYMALTEVLLSPADGYVIDAREDPGIGNQLKEPDTGWDHVLAFYIVTVRNK